MAIVLGLAVTFLLPQIIMASTIGSISGKIVDEETGDLLPGVAVSIVGTTMGALSNENGEYLILNVPVGTYIVRASLIGFSPVEITNTSVSADLTAYTDFKLSKKALDLGKTIVVKAERPLVTKDKTTTINITTRDELQAMPIRGYEQVVGLQNSVVRMNSNVDTRQRGARESSLAPEINLRGGRPSEVAYYVDGFSQQDPLSGISTANIANNAIKEVSVTSGAFSAEYGHVASGIVNVVTNSGSDKYHGDLELVSDNIASIFGYDSYDQNYYSADLSGPILLMEKAYFFFSGERRYLRDRTPSRVTKEVYERFGMDKYVDEPQRMPNNSLGGYSYQGKLDFQVMENLKLSVNGNGSLDNWQEYRHYYFNPSFPDQVKHSPRYEDRNLGLNAKITHQLNPKTFYNLSASYFKTSRLRADGAIFDDYEAYERAVANPEFDYYNLFREGDSIFASDLDPLIEPGSVEDTFVTFYESYWPNYLAHEASYIGFKGDITTQLTGSHTTKFGFDMQLHTLSFFENLNATQGYSQERVNRYGYDSLGQLENITDWRNDTKHPINIGAYVQDRFEWGGFIVNAGLRFDYFDYEALRWKNIRLPLGADRMTVDEADLEDSKVFTRVSPRLGISFPVSDKTQIYMNFGKFFQRPDLLRLYAGYDFLETRVGTGGSYYPLGNPNLEPEKTTQYEFGITQQLGENTAFDIAAYYKDVQDLTQIMQISPADPKEYSVYSNVDFGTIKGVDFSLNMRRTRNIRINLKYSLSYATGTGSYAETQFNVIWKNPNGVPKVTNPLDYDQRHCVIGLIDFRTIKGEGPKLGDIYPLEKIGLNFVFQVGSGTPYTPTQIYDAVSPNASVQQIPTGSINSANLPWQFTIDVKLEKGISLGSYELVPYVWVKNLLNTKNVLDIYEGTGKAYTSGYLETPEAEIRTADPGHPDFAYRYDLAQNNPKNYSAPRMIFIGMRMSF